MQFKHPEVLYFLFLLVIPIIIHLFQLRRFKKTYFTNVKLLKELQQQTQKSSTIKKWLLLATRLLLLAALIIAFAQPFFTAKDSVGKQNELVILLDNSFSMQAKGSNGELLKKAVQDILESLPENTLFSMVTPSQTYWDTDRKSIQSDLQNLTYTHFSFNIEQLINQVENKKPTTQKDYIIITDGISEAAENLTPLNKDNTYVWLPKTENKINCSIESVNLKADSDIFYELIISLKAYGGLPENIPLTLFNNNETVAKTQVSFKNTTEEIKLSIPKKAFNGKVSINDNSLPYDNSYYFSINEPKKNAILAIGETSKNEFLTRILNDTEFAFSQTELKQLNYNAIENQNVVILNELIDIPQSLSTTLQTFYQNGGTIVCIPNEKSTVTNLNSALQKWSALSFTQSFSSEKEITQIHFNHPLYRNVFEKKVTNFQYPKINTGFELKGTAFAVLSFADGLPFLASVSNTFGNIYIFSSPINKQNSNFQNSPLIVPTFYNIGIAKGNQSLAAYTISENQSVVLNAILSKDEVVTAKNEVYSFIPIQQISNDKLKLSFGDYPEKDGNYTIYQKENTIATISFNYPRNESNITLKPNSLFENYETITSVSQAIDVFNQNRTDTPLWKWFLAATLLFLLFELLIQKFVK
ncbi:BatA and WFA domain-containing protein [Flavobacterium sp.]|uniref:vWA domain-containing protein n=1 Tax=Flavobacterium sp. TaxID=239 RepID=UPI003526C7F6